MEFAEKFVAYIDILGFKNLTDRAAAGTEPSLGELHELQRSLGEKRWPDICPRSERQRSDLGFCVGQESDCAAISAEISPAGVVNLVAHCWTLVFGLLNRGLMCRGYITRGLVFHADGRFPLGPSFNVAVEQERRVAAFRRRADELGTPFVEVHKVVCDYVNECGDACVKEIFSRCVETDDGVSAIFPFKRLAHSFIIGGRGSGFDSEKELRANQNLRAKIERFKARVEGNVNGSDDGVKVKTAHYIRCLDAQIKQCERTEEFIKLLEKAPYQTNP